VLLHVQALAQAPAISAIDHYTENRGWNQAGLGPTHQVVVAARVVPSGFPTLVYAEAGGQREALTHFPQPGAPDLYVMWKRYEPGAAKAWRLRAEREGQRAPEVDSPALDRPRALPLARRVQVAGAGTQPRLSWRFPGPKSANATRIRVGIRGGERVHGRFMSLLYVSGDLPPAATSFRIPAGVLAAGERYVFQVMLEELEGGALRNRSLSFSEPYVVARREDLR
jgi:hypothetical protein